MRTFNVVLLSALVLACTIGSPQVLARIVYCPGYETMAKEADLVVIATAVARKELPGEYYLPGIYRGNKKSIPAVAIETTFKAMAVLKGRLAKGQERFVLFHYRELDPPEDCANCAQLVHFIPNDRSQYLMFLKRGNDGRYEPFNGQTDPVHSIEKLKQKRFIR